MCALFFSFHLGDSLGRSACINFAKVTKHERCRFISQTFFNEVLSGGSITRGEPVSASADETVRRLHFQLLFFLSFPTPHFNNNSPTTVPLGTFANDWSFWGAFSSSR